MTLLQAADATSDAAPDAAIIDQTTHSLLTRQLELEMQKRRPDPFIIGVICRSIGGVPSNLRSQVWQELLGVARTERLSLDQSIRQVEEDLNNQRVIAADAVRTRSNEVRFQAPATVELVVKLLTYYCKCRSIQYKQGMNEVLAPFLLLVEQRDGSHEETPLADGVVFQCFYALIDRYLPHVFEDQEFRSLQCSLQLFRLLMLYHDPELCHYLDQQDMTPELYVTPWFITLFARSLPPEYVFYLWDFILLENDPCIPHFVAFALVAAHREEIFVADIATLPQVLSSLTFSSRDELERVCANALLASKSTPQSFKRDLHSVCYEGLTQATASFFEHLHASSSLQIYPEELVQNLMDRLAIQRKQKRVYKRTTTGVAMQQEPFMLTSSISRPFSTTDGEEEASALTFLLLDCRPAEENHRSHLSLSHHIDPGVMERPDALDRLMQGFARMKGCHFCFVGPSVDSPAVQSNPLSKISGLDRITCLTSVVSNDKLEPESSQRIAKFHGAGKITDFGPLLTSPVTRFKSFGEPGAFDTVTSSREDAMLHAEHVSVTRIVLMFLQKGFKHVSRLHGGFDKLEQSIRTMDLFAQEQLLLSSPSPLPVPQPVMDLPDLVRSTSTGRFNLLAKIGLHRSRTPSQAQLATEVEGSPCSNVLATSSNQSSTQKSSTPSHLSALNSSKSSEQAKNGTLTQKNTTSRAGFALSQGLTLLKAATRGAVSSSSTSISCAPSDAPAESIQLAHKLYCTSDEGWVDVRVQTNNVLANREQHAFNIELQSGPIGILFQKSRTIFQAVVDSVVPDTQASATGLISTGDFLVAINGVSLEGVPFPTVIDRIIKAPRPVLARFITPLHGHRGQAHSVFKRPPLAPTLVCATRHSLCITWDSMVAPPSVARSQLQFAKQIGDEFTGWLPVAIRQEGTTAEVDTTGITDKTNGTMVGLEPGESLVFRVRCGYGQEWGPYSLPSGSMRSLNIRVSSSVSGTITPNSRSSKDLLTAIFLPGVCPEYIERGQFVYRVLRSFHARSRPDFFAEKRNLLLKKGLVIKGSERLVCPGRNQVFVRLGLGDTEDIVHQEQYHELILLRNGHWKADNNTAGIWAFEYTPDGDIVLERLSEVAEKVNGPSFQHHAKSLVQIFLDSSDTAISSSIRKASHEDMDCNQADSISSMAGNNRNGNSTAGFVAPVLVAPHIVQVFAASSSEVVITWDPVNDAGVTKYRIQYAKNRLAAMWWTVKPDIGADTLKSSVLGLQSNTPYLFRIRCGSNDDKWSPYSEPSERCSTLLSGRISTNSSPSDDSTPTRVDF